MAFDYDIQWQGHLGGAILEAGEVSSVSGSVCVDIATHCSRIIFGIAVSELTDHCVGYADTGSVDGFATFHFTDNTATGNMNYFLVGH